MKKSRVYIKDGERLKEAIAEILEDFGLVYLTGKKVLVKPNMLRAAKPGEGVVTHPLLLSETVSLLVDAGAEVTVGDNSAPNRSCNEIEIAQACGFLDASQGRFRNISRYSKKIKRQRHLLKEVYVSREVLECDILISLPKVKYHDLTTMSIAVKNHFGIIPGGLKPYIHSLFPKIDDFSKVLLEIYDIRPPDVIIVDCIDIVDAKGKRFTPGKIIAGDNGHAIDYICAKVAGVNPNLVPTLRIAKEEGLFDPDNIEYVGEIEQLKGYSGPVRFPLRNTVVEFVARIIYRIWLNRKPVIDSSVCARCLACENVCPKKAIKNQKIDYKKCIKCYCCLEVCPNRAITTKYKL